MITPDFETRSEVDITKCGASVYARHESTEILCLAWVDKSGVTHLWKRGDAPPQTLFESIRNGELFEAHNAAFERLIWRWICHERLGWPDVPFDQWRCTAAACARLALPRSLAGAGSALGLEVQKDDEGHRLMLKMCKPRKATKNDSSKWHESPSDLRRLYQYCERDVETQRLLSQTADALTPSELKVWQLDQRINLRGLPIDLEAVNLASKIVASASSSFDDDISALTNGEVERPTQTARIKKWIADRGVVASSIGKDVLAEMLDEGNPKNIPDDVRQILTIRQRASKSSTAKLNAFQLRCDSDGRVRGNLMYYGASTGRWAGTGVQIQNFPQGKFSQDDIELGHRLLKLRSPEPIDMIIGNPLDVISSMLRSFIRAEHGKRLLVGDFASIEARVLAWVSEQTDLLSIFESGGDVYKVMASKIYGVEVEDVTKAQRQIGKMAILGLGYGMGWKAFRLACRTMARVEISKKFAKQVVKTYRESNGRISAFWKECNTAAIRAVQTQMPHAVGRLTFEANSDWLKIRLPSGRQLHYRSPEVIEVRAPWSEGYHGEIHLSGDENVMDRVLNVLDRIDADVGEVSPDHIEVEHVPKNVDLVGLDLALGPAANTELEEKEPEYVPQVRYMSNIMGNRWGWDRTYGGKLTENVVQAIARDFLCESMLRLEDHGYPIIATVHDEVIVERPEGEGTLDEFIELLSTVPRWGNGCPIASEGYEAKRYRK